MDPTEKAVWYIMPLIFGAFHIIPINNLIDMGHEQEVTIDQEIL